MWRIRCAIVAAIVFLGPAVTARADVIYSNLGPPPGFSATDGFGLSDTSSWFMGFELSAAARLTSITVPVQLLSIAPEQVSIRLLASAGGLPDFSFVGTIEHLFAPLPADARPNTFLTVSAASVAQPLLAANTLYFFALHSGGPIDILGWPANIAGLQGRAVLAAVGPPGVAFTRTLGAFQLEGDPAPIPEPATLWLLAGGAALGVRKLRRRASCDARANHKGLQDHQAGHNNSL